MALSRKHAKMRDEAAALLSQIVNEREDAWADRSEKWQEGDKGADVVTAPETLVGWAGEMERNAEAFEREFPNDAGAKVVAANNRRLAAAIRAADEELKALREVIRVNELCHDSDLKVGAVEYCRGCEAQQRRLFGRAPDADALALLRGEVDRYLERPGCNIQARATALQRLQWAVDEAKKKATT